MLPYGFKSETSSTRVADRFKSISTRGDVHLPFRKFKFPKRQQRCFQNVHGAAGVMGSEASGFPQNNLHSAVGNKNCFANVFLLITFPSRAGEAAFCYEALVL